MPYSGTNQFLTGSRDGTLTKVQYTYVSCMSDYIFKRLRLFLSKIQSILRCKTVRHLFATFLLAQRNHLTYHQHTRCSLRSHLKYHLSAWPCWSPPQTCQDRPPNIVTLHLHTSHKEHNIAHDLQILAYPQESTKYDLLSFQPLAQKPHSRLLYHDSSSIQGTLFGGGTSVKGIINGTTSEVIYPNQLLGNSGPLHIARVSRTSNLVWHPTPLLPVQRSNHELDRILSESILEHMKHYCQLPAQNIITYSAKEKIFITSTQLCNILTNGKSINDEVIHLYLETFCTSLNLAFVCPQFYPLLLRNGWHQVARFFSPAKSHPKRSIYKPGLTGEPAIALPCFVHGCHWVAVARRAIGDRVLFFYSDDLNAKTTEIEIRNRLRSTDPTFYPPNAEWINCHSLTYQPHFNECGLRTILALTIMIAHPAPHKDMLLPFMHPNLSQILRTWTASVLLSGVAIIPSMAPPYDVSRSISSVSEPASLIHWDQPPLPNRSLAAAATMSHHTINLPPYCPSISEVPKCAQQAIDVSKSSQVDESKLTQTPADTYSRQSSKLKVTRIPKLTNQPKHLPLNQRNLQYHTPAVPPR
jgi:hypothetical protein